MAPAEVATQSLAEVARLISARAVSPVEVTEAVLSRIECLDRELNAFITVTAEGAMRAARTAAEEIVRGRYRGPLHGVPISLKDLFETRGVRTTAGSKVLADNVPQRDATVVRKLSAAGAVVIGKTNMLEFAYGEVCPAYGPSRNPWNLAYGTNGSSSGSAAAVAASLGYASMGSDTGGSIRLPAAFCGIVGLKPTYGLVSRAGVVPLSWSLDHVGPMTRTVLDCAIMLDAVAGYDRADAGSVRAPLHRYADSLGQALPRLKVGVVQPEPDDGVMPEVRQSLDVTADLLRGLGHDTLSVALPNPEQTQRALFAILYPEAGTYHRHWLATCPDAYSPNTRERLELGTLLPATSYLQALRARRTISATYQTLLREVDLLLLPAAPFPSYRLDQPPVEPVDGTGRDRMAGLIRFSGPFDLTGLPALSLPVGTTLDGLPIGVQLAGRAFDEARLLQVALAIEGATPKPSRRLDPALSRS